MGITHGHKACVMPDAHEVRHDAGPTATLDQPMEEARMQWTTPSYTDVRLGFEIVMYVATR
ncbi:pyrroloquinoline quinone precursor peptide PqqA [Paraburkholderia panacisoli]|nr:pyrroloquinoline quinone precursor peptide PqqA [Paraburkholderia panacisoli]